MSNTTANTHFVIKPCEWDDSKPEFGLQLFYVLAGSQWSDMGKPPQNQNFTTQWIPFGELGYDTDPNTGYADQPPLNGWRFHSFPGGSRVEAKPHDGTNFQFLNTTLYNV